MMNQMQKLISIAALALTVSLSATAQDTYESGRLLGSDLNGTARYVGMGGAMEALGADISTMSSNPAGIALFRRSSVSATVGIVAQADVQKLLEDDWKKTRLSFDQFGFVYSNRISRSSYINVGFNYHKSRNFSQILNAANSLRNASANGLTYDKADRENVRKGGFYWDFNKQGDVIGYENETSDYRAQTFSQMDYLNINALMLESNEDNAAIYYNNADEYDFSRQHKGWINDYDFCVSGNHNDRIYWGITVGIHDVDYRGTSAYSEALVDQAGDAGIVDYIDERRIDGTGIDVKAGVIFRPVEASPFRIGAYIATPTWYELTTTNDTYLLNDTKYGEWDDMWTGESYDFRYFTPWRFGLSLGHTVGTQLAVGLTYEYADYGSAKNRILNDYSDYDGYTRSYTDDPMARNTDDVLKGTHLIKAGVEFKPLPELSVRAGFNYISASYNKNGYRDQTLDSPGVAYASTTDYVNWDATYRYTCGLGYRAGQWNFDLAYQYSQTKGDFHPFQPYGSNYDSGVAQVSNKRHQALLTVGYNF